MSYFACYTLLTKLYKQLYSPSILRKEDLQGEDWKEESRGQGVGQGGLQEVGCHNVGVGCNISFYQAGEHTVEELKEINQQLYKFALKNVLKS